MTQIKHRITGAVLHEGPGTLREELQKAASIADLSGADLSGANLIGANLSWADLSGADLSGANLSRANLSWVNLNGANLSGADLSGANLSGANLRWANLNGANLSWVNLSGADLSGADLIGAGVLCLHIGDPRGYRPVAVWHDQWVIFAGCRKFTIAQAREHWGVKYHGIRSTGDQYLAAMDWLEKQPKPEDVK